MAIVADSRFDDALDQRADLDDLAPADVTQHGDASGPHRLSPDPCKRKIRSCHRPGPSQPAIVRSSDGEGGLRRHEPGCARVTRSRRGTLAPDMPLRIVLVEYADPPHKIDRSRQAPGDHRLRVRAVPSDGA